jgi:hypothetical protein
VATGAAIFVAFGDVRLAGRGRIAAGGIAIDRGSNPCVTPIRSGGCFAPFEIGSEQRATRRQTKKDDQADEAG